MIDTGPLVVVIIRLLVPLLIFRFRFWGYVAALIADSVDVILLDWINIGGLVHYHEVDKALDLYMLAIAVFETRKWKPLQRTASFVLFGWRFIGDVLFEVTGLRWLFILFPNVFGLYYLVEAYRLRYKPKLQMTKRRLIILLSALLIIALITEFILHVLKLPLWDMFKKLF